VKENYLPISLYDLLSKFEKNYITVHRDLFTLDFLKRKVKEDFDIDLKETTHLKLIMKRK
jgi:hypothetical protein